MRGHSKASIQAPPNHTPCRTGDPDLWFAEQPTRLDAARALCAACPIKQACLDGALERAEPWGVWGGEIVQEGVVLAYKRGRGRPSNADRALGLVTRIADRRHQGGGPRSITTPGRAGTCHSRSA